MTYNPIPAGVLVPGLGGERYVSQLLGSLDSCYEQHQVQVLNCATSLEVSSSSATLVAEFVLPGNLDNRDIQVKALWRGTTGQTAELKVVVDDGVTTDEDQLNSTTSSYALDTLTLPLVNTSGPLRYVQIYLSCTAAALTRIDHLVCLIPAPVTYPDGPLASGAAKLDGWALTSTSGPWPREVVQRMTENVRAVARDRRSCLVSALHRYGASGPNYEKPGNTFQLVERFLWPGGDPALRKYRVSLKLGGTNPQARLQLGPYELLATGAGWSQQTPSLYLPRGTPGFLWVQSTSGHTANVDTFQMFREPA